MCHSVHMGTAKSQFIMHILAEFCFKQNCSGYINIANDKMLFQPKRIDIFLISSQKCTLLVHIRSISARRFQGVPTTYVFRMK